MYGNIVSLKGLSMKQPKPLSYLLVWLLILLIALIDQLWLRLILMSGGLVLLIYFDILDVFKRPNNHR